MIWRTTLICVDIETGVIISKWTAEEHYTFIKSIKNKKHGNKPHIGIIEFTKLYRRNNSYQGKLFS